MSKAVLIYDMPSDKSLRYTKRVHSKDLGRPIWNVMLKTLSVQRESRGNEPVAELSEDMLISECGSRFHSNHLVQTVYEVGRACGVDAEIPVFESGQLVADNVLGVFYIR